MALPALTGTGESRLQELEVGQSALGPTSSGRTVHTEVKSHVQFSHAGSFWFPASGQLGFSVADHASLEGGGSVQQRTCALKVLWDAGPSSDTPAQASESCAPEVHPVSVCCGPKTVRFCRSLRPVPGSKLSDVEWPPLGWPAGADRPDLQFLQFPFRLSVLPRDLEHDRRCCSFLPESTVAKYHRDFVFSVSRQAELRRCQFLRQPHQALVALACPEFGVCQLTTGFAVAPSASDLRLFLREALPEVAEYLILDTRELFSEAFLYVLLAEHQPMTCWMRTDAPDFDVVLLPISVRPEFGIPRAHGFHIKVFRQAGAWGLYTIAPGFPPFPPQIPFQSWAIADLETADREPSFDDIIFASPLPLPPSSEQETPYRPARVKLVWS